MGVYSALNKQEFHQGHYSLVPIRMQDRYDIMQWRNEQIYHLRQSKPLSKEDQDRYFDTVVPALFDQARPDQLLFSYLEEGKCIGYGGLVHINWLDRNAEVSFIMATQLEQDGFHKHWGIYLNLLYQIAFDELDLHKLYTYAFDLRPHLYTTLEAQGFVREAVLPEHCLFDGEYKDVVIHSRFNELLSLRTMSAEDKSLTYAWANDSLTRANSFDSRPIPFDSHSTWFDSKLNDQNARYYIAEIKGQALGLLRFDTRDQQIVMGITISQEYRGKKLSARLLQKACGLVAPKTELPIVAYIKQGNIPSIKAFEKAGFIYQADLQINGIDSHEYRYKK